MENLSFEEKKGMELTVETLGVSIWEWIEKEYGGEKVKAVAELSKRSGVSARTIDSIKNYNGGPNKPDPHLSTMQKIALVTNSKLEINKKFDSE